MEGIEIKADDGQVRILVLDCERVHAECADDTNWLSCVVEIDVPPFAGRFEAAFQVQDFSQLRKDLEVISERLEGEAVFLPLERALQLKFAMKNRGGMLISGEARPTVSSDAKLQFGLNADQSMLGAVILALKAVERRYPPMGEPDGAA